MTANLSTLTEEVFVLQKDGDILLLPYFASTYCFLQSWSVDRSGISLSYLKVNKNSLFFIYFIVLAS